MRRMKKLLICVCIVMVSACLVSGGISIAAQKNKGVIYSNIDENEDESTDEIRPMLQDKNSARPRMIEVEEELWYRLNKDLLELQDEIIKTKAKAKVDEAEMERLKNQLKESGKKKGRWQEVHRVQKNDSLWKIAKRYYNDPYKWRWIFKENIKQVTDPDMIYPEQVLDIPQY